MNANTMALTVQLGGRAASPIDPTSPEFERTATRIAGEFSAAMTDIATAFAALNAATKRLDDAFDAEPERHYSRFGVDLEYHRHRCADIDEVRKRMEREAWRVLVDMLGIKNVMSVAKRKVFDAQLESGELPPVSEQTITAILLGFADQARDFATEAAREVFDLLRPQRGGYATNNTFRVGRRVILTNRVERNYGPGWHVAHYYEQEMTAIDGVFHLLDGKGVMRANKGPLIAAIGAVDASGKGETEYVRFKCFKNRNLHLEFKRLDLVKQLNGLAAGEYVLGEDVA